jgi:Ca2+-binding EF-hand superfamily protein
MKYSPLLMFAAALALNTPALASSALFEVLDRDDNNYLTLEETQAKTQLYLQFSAIDRNQNNQLEPEELQLLNMPPAFSDIDMDESLGITPEEASALRVLQNQFSQVDRNEDQIIDPAEFAEFVPQG